MVLKSQVNFTGKTSLEVGVQVFAENCITGTRTLTTEALLTFVATGKTGKPVKVRPLLPETKEEKRRFKEGQTRYEARRKQRKNR